MDTNNQIKLLSLFSDFVSEFIVEFVNANVDTEEVLNSWTSDSNQEKVKNIISSFFDKKLNAYQIFAADKRTELKHNEPGLSFVETNKKIGKMWNTVKTEQPDIYEHYKSLTDKTKPQIKKPRSAYNFFCMENRDIVTKKYPTLSGKEITKKLAILWNKCNYSNNPEILEELDYCFKLAEEDKLRYKKELSEIDNNDFEQRVKKSGKLAYHYYMSDYRDSVKKQNPELDHKEITSMISNMWQDCKKQNGEEYKKYKNMELLNNVNKESKIVTNLVSKFSTDSDKFKKYCLENKQKVKDMFPDMCAIDVTKYLRKMWLNSDK